MVMDGMDVRARCWKRTVDFWTPAIAAATCTTHDGLHFRGKTRDGRQPFSPRQIVADNSPKTRWASLPFQSFCSVFIMLVRLVKMESVKCSWTWWIETIDLLANTTDIHGGGAFAKFDAIFPISQPLCDLKHSMFAFDLINNVCRTCNACNEAIKSQSQLGVKSKNHCHPQLALSCTLSDRIKTPHSFR